VLKNLAALVPPALPTLDPLIVEQAIAVGDISKMTPVMRIAYYRASCESCGLNPLTRPFDVLKAEDGSMRLYANARAAEQLRKLHQVSLRIMQRDFDREAGLYTVVVQASTPDGRCDESIAMVPTNKARGEWKESSSGKRYFAAQKDKEGNDVLAPLTGEPLCNAIARAETKAKRRVTMSICGLGFAAREDDREASGWQEFDPQTGEVRPPRTQTPFQVPAPDETVLTHATRLLGELYGEEPIPNTSGAHQDAPGGTKTSRPYPEVEGEPVDETTGEIRSEDGILLR
jgi:hypothetical protein